MNTSTLHKTILFSLATLSCGWADESKEPPQTFSLKVGDKTIKITEGQPFELDKVETKTQGVLKKDPLRTFKAKGIEFSYPTTMSFESDHTDPAALSWTLNGNDTTVMFFSMQATTTTEELAESMVDSFGKKNCTIKPGKLKLAGEECAVSILSAKVAEQSLQMEIIGIKSDDNTSRLLVLQDMLGEDGKHSKEYEAVKKTIIESFSKTKKP